MARGRRGSNRGSRPSPSRGRGRGRGRGFRGANHSGRGRVGGSDHGSLVFEGNFEDLNFDHIIPPGQRPSARPGRGRGGYLTPRGGRVLRGIGFSASFNGPRIPISTLERDRPLLRPVVFVRGENQQTLFKEAEEILHVQGEEGIATEDHAPSADVVERLFKCHSPKGVSPASGRDGSPTSESEAAGEDEGPVAAEMAMEEPAPVSIVDTMPSPVVLSSPHSEHAIEPSVRYVTPLGDTADEEVIVYVAPYPRKSHSGSTIHATQHPASEPSLLPSDKSPLTRPGDSSGPLASTPIDSISIPVTVSYDADKVLAAQVEARRRIGLKPTPRSRKMAKKERAAARRRDERGTMFYFGLSMEERFAFQEGPTAKEDTRRAERRKGDSDVDWGSDDESGIEEVTSGIGDMSLDGEIGDIGPAFAQFACGVEGLGAGEVVTIADLEDEARMNEEGEELDAEDSSEDEDAVDSEMRRENGDDADSSEISDDETPRRGFHARLRRLRKEANGKAVVDLDPTSDEDASADDEDPFGTKSSWADRDESFLRGVELDLLSVNNGTLRHGGRVTQRILSKAIWNGDFEDDYDTFESPNMRKKDRKIPPQLRDQWNRDRAKKAEYKRDRARLARLQAASSPSPTRRSSGKKTQKIYGAARLDGDTLFVERVGDMALLEQQIRNFLNDQELKNLVFPPIGKDWRKGAHSLAATFNLRSRSKGGGGGRFMTLCKTTRSGVSVNQQKISRFVNGHKGEGFGTSATKRSGLVAKHRDGDEVGKAAPKLSNTNIGFRLLQRMGWEEGDQIGVTGGLIDPLTAIFKTTKLGLGATR